MQVVMFAAAVAGLLALSAAAPARADVITQTTTVTLGFDGLGSSGSYDSFLPNLLPSLEGRVKDVTARFDGTAQFDQAANAVPPIPSTSLFYLATILTIGGVGSNGLTLPIYSSYGSVQPVSLSQNVAEIAGSFALAGAQDVLSLASAPGTTAFDISLAATQLSFLPGIPFAGVRRDTLYIFGVVSITYELPEPSSLALLGAGVASLAWLGRRRSEALS
ncbi:MAG: hypothetical protein NVSMB18_31060 [Acetobacteraceae bacterium]